MILRNTNLAIDDAASSSSGIIDIANHDVASAANGNDDDNDNRYYEPATSYDSMLGDDASSVCRRSNAANDNDGGDTRAGCSSPNVTMEGWMPLEDDLFPTLDFTTYTHNAIIHPEEDKDANAGDKTDVDDILRKTNRHHDDDDAPPILLLPPSLYAENEDLQQQQQRARNHDMENNNNAVASSLVSGRAETNIAPSDYAPTATPTTMTTTIQRKRPTGLGNLGNTCFMNSTLQCLAHTPPLRQYLLSGKYESDLNVENPLGTGGELAREFASLMREMWLEKAATAPADGQEEEERKNNGNHHRPLATAAGNGIIYTSSRMYSPGNGGSYPEKTGTASHYYYLSNGDGGGGDDASSNAPTVTYPRSFKTTLGKHAPQFVGYDQHDSQELAIYLLDALHEDTNRVRKKPYVINPEQSPAETDDDAAKKAWDVHLQREDSFVVHNFMGQIKSRLQCPNNGSNSTNLAAADVEKKACGRVSTTFDPCMYLSVPIPGSTDRVVKVVFVPLLSSSSSTSGSNGKSTHPLVASAEFTIKLCKNSSLKSLLREVVKSARERYAYTEEDLDEEDVQLVDIFNNQIWSYYDDLDRAIDGIKDSDVTYAYQLFPLKRVKEEVGRYLRMVEDCFTNDEQVGSIPTQPSSLSSFSTLELLDAATKAELDTNSKWENKLLKFVVKPTAMCHMLNEKKSNHKERLDFYGSLIKFIQRCQLCPDATSASTAMDATSESIDGDTVMASPSVSSSPAKRLSSSTSQPTLEEVSYTSSQFKGVHTPRDLAILEYCVSKYLARINKLHRIASNRNMIAKEYNMVVPSFATDDIINNNENGLVVQIKIRKCDDSSSSSSYCNYGKYSSYSRDFVWTIVGDVPMVVRLSPTLTISGLRRLLGQRLLHSCCASNVSTSEEHPSNGGGRNHHLVGDDHQTMKEESSSGDMTSLSSVMQEVAFAWEDDTSHGNGGRGDWSVRGGGSGNNHHDPKEFGSVTLDHFSSTHSMKPHGSGGGKGNGNDKKKEMELVANIVKNHSTIIVSWPPRFNNVLDESALCAREEYLTQQQRKEIEDEEEQVEEKEEGDDDKDEDDIIPSSSAASPSSSNGNKRQKMKTKLKQMKKTKRKKGVSIMDCIHKYCEMEQLDDSEMWYCNQCKEHVRAWKQFHLYRTPPILIIHLKRFHYSSTTHRRDKIDTLIDFPLTDLDLRSVVKHNNWEVGQEPIYDCYAVSNHFGGLGGGHYTAYARWGGGEKGVGGEDGQSSSWYLFDDSRVTPCVDESEVVSNAAYCLYYKRKDDLFNAGDDDGEEDNEELMRISTSITKTMTTTMMKQLGVNDPNDTGTEPPRFSFDDINNNDAAMEEEEEEVVVSVERSSSSSAASYVTPNTSIHDGDDDDNDYDDGMMNDVII